MQLKAEVRRFVVGRWSPWLRFALACATASPAALARELKDARARRLEDVDDANIPRALVKRWINGETPANANSAFAVGNALALIGHPYASGLLAAVVAGHFGDFVRTIRVLATTAKGASFAAKIIASLPLLAEAEVAEAQGWSHFFKYRRLKGDKVIMGPSFPISTPPVYKYEVGVGYIEAINGARDRLRGMQHRFASTEIESAWNARHSASLCHETEQLKRYDDSLLLALQNAEAAEARSVPMLLRWEITGLLIDRWADEINKRHHMFYFAYPIFRDIIQLSALLRREQQHE